MNHPLFIALPQLQDLYLLAVGSAILFFLIFYLRDLFMRGKAGTASSPGPSPSWLWSWLSFLYPRWLDRLTLGQIFRGFAWALGSAAVSWIISAVIFLMVIAKVYGP